MGRTEKHKPFFINGMVRVWHVHRQWVAENCGCFFKRYSVFAQIGLCLHRIPLKMIAHESITQLQCLIPKPAQRPAMCLRGLFLASMLSPAQVCVKAGIHEASVACHSSESLLTKLTTVVMIARHHGPLDDAHPWCPPADAKRNRI